MPVSVIGLIKIPASMMSDDEQDEKYIIGNKYDE
jgi:hypothetical protein